MFGLNSKTFWKFVDVYIVQSVTYDTYLYMRTLKRNPYLILGFIVVVPFLRYWLAPKFVQRVNYVTYLISFFILSRRTKFATYSYQEPRYLWNIFHNLIWLSLFAFKLFVTITSYLYLSFYNCSDQIDTSFLFWKEILK